MGDFTEFYRRHQHVLLNYLVRLTGDTALAMEIAQESFTRCLSRYGSGKLNRVLLFKIARNAWIDEIRRQKRFTGFKEEEHPAARNPEKHLQIRAEYQRVMAAMERLEQEEREILAMRVSTKLTYREIAAISGLNETNVRVKVHRARVKLKQLLDLEEKP
jgi:RNA polymerase sigma-70 factor (ECF subfamily)